jgi:predicted kinase
VLALRGQSFVLNATSLSRDLRARWITLFADYRARVRLVHVEAPHVVLVARNRRRERRVPENVLDRLIDLWDPPDLTEAHAVEHQRTT